MKLFSHRKRPVHCGPYPLENLPRLSDPAARPPGFCPGATLVTPEESEREGPHGAGHAYRRYFEIFDAQTEGDVAPPAPIPADRGERVRHLKAGLYFLNADMAGCGVIPEDAWQISSPPPAHHFALVILVAYGHRPRAPEPGAAWVDGTRHTNAALRAAELAVITASYLRNLGYAATAHTPTRSQLSLGRVALQAGIVEIAQSRASACVLRAPYIDRGFALAAVSTSLELAPEAPLARRNFWQNWRCTRGPRWWFGSAGTRSALSRFASARRALHLGRYPMEKIRRVPQPTTLVLEDEVQRVPVRAGGFPRAHNGDMGPRLQAEVQRFAYKTPQARSYITQIEEMVPHQDGPVAAERAPECTDPVHNARAVKALAYHLGGDMVGVCRVPRYAWYSHHANGELIEPYHKNAIVILLDQGYETMEGASGDDWVSGAQSMRAYMRGAQIAGILAEHIRSLGYGARSQTNRLSDVLHIPLLLQAGLGELSRIGELVLNPFVGPRFKSVVVSTDLPLAPDRPIDFGLQDFCSKCNKCARECPCGAIPFGEKVMFNGAEMWKPDVENCTKYRISNQKGSACGRCMKTCPFNIEGVLAERVVLWAAIKIPALRAWIARLDDKLRNGSINPVKKWWWDLEWRDARAGPPAQGTNARDLDLTRVRLAKTQRIAHYTPDVLPAGDAIQVPVALDRKAALACAARAETPSQARARALEESVRKEAS